MGIAAITRALSVRITASFPEYAIDSSRLVDKALKIEFFGYNLFPYLRIIVSFLVIVLTLALECRIINSFLFNFIVSETMYNGVAGEVAGTASLMSTCCVYFSMARVGRQLVLVGSNPAAAKLFMLKIIAWPIGRWIYG
jgi:hypothetical protein